jgi:hypothetical protein
MQLQFHQDTCSCLRRLVNQTNVQEQTQEIKLPEGMPDIGRVLGAWGQILIRGKEWNSVYANVSGGVQAGCCMHRRTDPPCAVSILGSRSNVVGNFQKPDGMGRSTYGRC